jgi:hypothetical protein
VIRFHAVCIVAVAWSLGAESRALARPVSTNPARALTLSPLKILASTECAKYVEWYLQDVKFGPVVAVVVAYPAHPRPSSLPAFWLRLDTAKGCFIRPGPIARGNDLTVYPSWQLLGKLLLVKWSSGTGVIDPPDSAYTPCEEAFMACAMGRRGEPLCSDPVRLVKVRHCGEAPGQNEAEEKVPDAHLSEDGTTFELEGLRFRIPREAK